MVLKIASFEQLDGSSSVIMPFTHNVISKWELFTPLMMSGLLFASLKRLSLFLLPAKDPKAAPWKRSTWMECPLLPVWWRCGETPSWVLALWLAVRNLWWSALSHQVGTRTQTREPQICIFRNWEFLSYGVFINTFGKSQTFCSCFKKWR